MASATHGLLLSDEITLQIHDILIKTTQIRCSTGTESVTQILELLKTLFQSLCKWHGESNLITEVRILDQTIAKVKKQPKVKPSTEVSRSLWADILEITTVLLCSTHDAVKVNRKLLQLFKELEKQFPDDVCICLEGHLEAVSVASSPSLLVLWSGLLSQTNCGKQLTIARLETILPALSEQLQIQLSHRCDSSWTLQKQHSLQASTKFLLEVLQHLRTTVCESLTHGPGQAAWQHVFGGLLMLLQTKGAPKDCSLFAGTAVVNLLVLCAGPESWPQTTYNLISLLGSGGDLECGFLRVTLFPSDEPGQIALGRLALVNGIVAMCDTESMCYSIDGATVNPSNEYKKCNDEESNRPLLIHLHKSICELCSLPNYQYQAFRLLLQWFGKVTKFQESIHHKLNTRIFFAGGGVVTRSLGLIWTHLDSSVDGVSESIHEIFSLLLGLEKQERVLSDTQKHDNSEREKPGFDEDSKTRDIDSRQGTNQIKHADHCSSDSQSSLSKGSPCDSINQSASKSTYALDFTDDLLQRVLRMSWEVRGRHHLVAVLLNFTDSVDVLRMNPLIINDLKRCLTTNHLAPAATHLYTAVLLQLSRTSDPVAVWSELCLCCVLDCLCADNQLVRLNFSQHLLPVTLKKMPRSLPMIQKYFEAELLQEDVADESKRERLLHGYLALLKTARNNQMLKQWPMSVLKEALMHPSNDIRLETLTLICVSPKTTEPMSSEECQLLFDNLHDNMNIDEPPFRRQLQANIKHSISRMRDVGLAALRERNSGNGRGELMSRAIDYIDWLWELCLHSLSPASNYQRLKACLDWMSLILDSLTPQTDRRKGGCPELSVNLMHLAQAQGQWHFYSPRTTWALLGCLLHDTDEIKLQASTILEKFFTWPLPLNEVHDEPPGDCTVVPSGDHAGLLSQALDLCNSPRARECESGALLTRLIFKKCILEAGYQFDLDYKLTKFTVTCRAAIDLEVAAVHFLEVLARLLQDCVTCAQGNILDAVKNKPAHGLIQACHSCITACRGRVSRPCLWQSSVRKLISMTTELIERVMGVFGVQLNSHESAPSFEQMGVSIQRVVANEHPSQDPCTEQPIRSGDELGDSAPESVSSAHTDTVLSPEQQMVMSWCWINIRECSVLLSSLVSSLPVTHQGGTDPSRQAGSEGVLTAGEVQSIAGTLVQVLTKCRHRGAIEGCNLGFSQLCLYLLSTSEPSLHSIPHKLLIQVLAQLSQLSRTSVTRRSAGLPLIVQSIIASEAKTKQSHLLTEAVTTLLTVLREDLPDTHNQQEDLPHVHALNILKAVIREASVSQAVMPHVTMATMLAIDLLSSPLWALRNSAMQLYGTLQSRMLGQKKTSDDSLYFTTAPEFFALYPDLHPYMMDKVKVAAAGLAMGKLRLHPSLFPVLSILAKLSPGLETTSMQGTLSVFYEPLQTLAASPLHAVRTLSAKAMVALVPRDQVQDYILGVIEDLPVSAQTCRSYNRVHGQLLQLSRLTHLHRESFVGHDVCSTLYKKSWLLDSSRHGNPCHLVGAAYLQLLLSVGGAEYLVSGDTSNHSSQTSSPQSRTEGGIGSLQQIVEQLLARSLQDDSTPKVGYSVYVATVVQAWLEYDLSPLKDKVSACLQTAATDVRIACLEWLQGQGREQTNNHQEDVKQSNRIKENSGGLQTILLKHILRKPSWQELCLTLTLLVDSSEVMDAHDLESDKVKVWDELMTLARSVSQPGAKALTATALILRNEIKVGDVDSIQESLSEWSELLWARSQPENSEILRLHAAKSLCIAGRDIITYTKHQAGTLSPICYRLMECCLELLQDEDADIRNCAARFVAQLTTSPKLQGFPLHYNTSLKLLTSVTSALPEGLPTLHWLYTYMGRASQGLVGKLQEAHNKKVEEQFEAGDINPYQETTVINMYLLHWAKNLTIPSSPDVTSWCDREVSSLKVRVLEVASVSESLSPDSPVLGATYSKPVYKGVHSLKCQSAILNHWCATLGLQNCSQKVQYCAKLLQMPGNHPCLDNFELYQRNITEKCFRS